MATLKDLHRTVSSLERFFLWLLLGLAAGWCLLALLCWLYPVIVVRVALGLATATVLLAGFAWYCLTRWVWQKQRFGLDRFTRPVTLFLFGWLLCLGSALTAGFAVKSDRESGTSTPPSTKPDVTPPPTSKLFARGPRRYLADMEEFDVKTAPDWPFLKNGKLNDKNAILVQGNLAIKGLSMHPPDSGYSSVKYRLNDEAAVFKGKAAIDDTGAPFFTPGHFEVLGDGITLWKSKEFKHEKGAPPEECNISVEKVRILELRYYSPSFKQGHHAVWVDPRVLQRPDTPDEK